MTAENTIHKNTVSAAVRTAQAVIVLAAFVFSFRFSSFLHPKEAVIGIGAVSVAIISMVMGHNIGAGMRRFMPLWLLWCFCVVVHVLFQGSAVPHFAVTALIQAAVLLIFAACITDPLANETARRAIRNAIVTAGAILAVLGLIQIAELAPWLFPVLPDYGQPMYSVFGNRNLLAIWLAMALPLSLYSILRNEWGVYFHAIASGTMIIALVLASSRTGWILGALASVLVLLATPVDVKRRIALAAGLLVLVLPALAIFHGPFVDTVSATGTLELRRWFWHSAGAMFVDHPLLGIGPGNFAYWSPEYQGNLIWNNPAAFPSANTVHTYHAHNDWLELIVIAGIPGAICVFWFLARLLRRRGPEWFALIPLAVGAVANPVLISAPHALAALLLAAGLLARLSLPHRETRRAGGVVVAAMLLGCALFQSWAVWLPSLRLRSADVAQLAGDDAVPLYANLAQQPWPQPLAEQGLAIAYMKAGRDHAAVEAWKRTRSEGLNSGELYYGMGLAALRSGNDELARESANSCLQRWPRDVDAWVLALTVTPRDEWKRLEEDGKQMLGAAWDDAFARANSLRSDSGTQ